jgi:hypothetical protein
MRDPYVSCYLSGRFNASSFDELEIDFDDLTEKVNSGKPIREVTLEVALEAITPEMDPVTKARWVKDNQEDIETLGGDNEKAWRLYMQGCIDALAHQLEDEVMSELEEMEGDDGGDSDESDDESEPDESEDSDSDDQEEKPVPAKRTARASRR